MVLKHSYSYSSVPVYCNYTLLAFQTIKLMCHTMSVYTLHKQGRPGIKAIFSIIIILGLELHTIITKNMYWYKSLIIINQVWNDIHLWMRCVSFCTLSFDL